MKLSNTFTIDRPVGEVYDAFLDVERVAACMPGSRLLGQPEPGTYEGEVKVKVGPLSASYSGRLTMVEIDADAHRLTMRAKGREQRGAGNAEAHVVATLVEENGRTVVRIDTDLTVRGTVAQFGRGVIGDVTDGIMQAFARNVESMLLSGEGSASSSPEPSGRVKTDEGATEGRLSTGTSVADEPAQALPSGQELDAWRVVVRPMLRAHAGSIALVAFATLAAYVGARTGARRRGDHRH